MLVQEEKKNQLYIQMQQDIIVLSIKWVNMNLS